MLRVPALSDGAKQSVEDIVCTDVQGASRPGTKRGRRVDDERDDARMPALWKRTRRGEKWDRHA